MLKTDWLLDWLIDVNSDIVVNQENVSRQMWSRAVSFDGRVSLSQTDLSQHNIHTNEVPSCL